MRYLTATINSIINIYYRFLKYLIWERLIENKLTTI
jgi:hypothetical protein